MKTCKNGDFRHFQPEIFFFKNRTRSRLASVCFSVDTVGGNSAYKVKRARENSNKKINCRVRVVWKTAWI